jgi:hypothetical protein
MRAMPFPDYIPALTRDRLNVFYSACQIFATSQVLFSYHLDEVFAGYGWNSCRIPFLRLSHLSSSFIVEFCNPNHDFNPYHSLVVLPIQIAALLMTMVRKSIISAGAWHYYYTLSLLSNYIVGPIAGWFNPAG